MNENIVIKELEKVKCRKKVSATDIFIQCPFHDGDNTPSLGVYISSDRKLPIGYFNCFGCGKKGEWNILADKLHLKQIDINDDKSKSISKYRLQEIRKNLLGNTKLVMPFGVPYKEDWRNISGNLLEEVGTILGYDDFEKISSLYFPVKIGNELVTIIKARLEKKYKKRSYIIIDGKIKDKGMFPYNKAVSMLDKHKYKNILIVEGIRDSLYLIDNKIPAISILSTNTWSKYKRNKIISLCHRYNLEPVIMMDYDNSYNNKKNAGMIAQKHIYNDLINHISTHQIHLKLYANKLNKKELDPADLPKSIIRKIYSSITI